MKKIKKNGKNINLSPDLSRIFHEIKKDIMPDSAFKKQLSHDLAEKYQEFMPQSAGFNFFYRFRFQLAGGLLLLFFTSSTIYAYSSPNVVEGNFLYPVKRGVEKVEELLARTSAEKRDYYHKMAERRIEEIEFFQARNIEVRERTILEAENMVERAKIIQNNQIRIKSPDNINQKIEKTESRLRELLPERIPLEERIELRVTEETNQDFEINFEETDDFEESREIEEKLEINNLIQIEKNFERPRQETSERRDIIDRPLEKKTAQDDFSSEPISPSENRNPVIPDFNSAEFNQNQVLESDLNLDIPEPPGKKKQRGPL